MSIGDPHSSLHERPRSPTDEEGHIDNYPSATQEQWIAPINFRPFFNLVEDSSTGEHFHPEVHYVFSDDDPETLTSSIINASESQHDDANHRLILVDMAADGRTIKAAHSLSSSWQVTQANIVPAPSWTDAGPETTTEGLMLKVEGTEAPKRNMRDGKAEEAEDAIHQMEADIEAYADRSNHLQSILAGQSML